MWEAPAGSALLLRGSPQQPADIMSKMVASLCVASLRRFFLLGNGSLTHRNENLRSLPCFETSLACMVSGHAATVVCPYEGLVSGGSTSNPTLCSLYRAVPSVLLPAQCEALGSCLLLIDSVLWHVSVCVYM